MQAAVPHRLFDRITLALVVVLLAAAVTYVEAVRPPLPFSWSALSSQSVPSTSSSTRAQAAKASSNSVAAASAAATAVKTAITNTYVHLRSDKSTASPILVQLPPGTTLQLRDDADVTWQGVAYQGRIGYVYRSYLQY